VQDVLLRAGVARSTFYAHFRDKEDVLMAGYESIGLLGGGHEFAIARDSVFDISQWLFMSTEHHAELTTAFFSSPSQNIILSHLECVLLIQAREQYKHREPKQPDELTTEIAVRSFVGALLSTWLWWVRHNYPCPAQAMAQKFEAQMLEGDW
jgi:AcrR family transcriptional regulator